MEVASAFQGVSPEDLTVEDGDLEMGHRNPMTGWWFGTFFIFPSIGNNHPN